MEKELKLKKSLGQNFLIDQNIITKILESLNIEEDSLIIEVGPGIGALTKKLVTLDTKLLCFEIDKRFSPFLKEIKASNLEIIYGDFLQVDLNSHLCKYKYKNLYVVANIPYYITSSIINKLVAETNVKEMVIMMQKEVGDRIISKPHSRNYGSLSVFLQFHFDIKKVLNVSRNCFKPKPNVDSVVLKFIASDKKSEVKSLDNFYKLVKDAFKHKRKNLKNNLINYDLQKISEVLKLEGKDLTYRAENLTVEDFINISNKIS